MVTPRTYDAVNGFSSESSKQRTTSNPTRRYLVVLTSDEECVYQEVEWTPEIAAAVSALCKQVNAQATWSASPRMHVNPIAAPTGEVA